MLSPVAGDAHRDYAVALGVDTFLPTPDVGEVVAAVESLCPVPIDAGPFALPAEPTPAPLAIGGLLLMVGVLLTFATRRARRLEVLYTGE